MSTFQLRLFADADRSTGRMVMEKAETGFASKRLMSILLICVVFSGTLFTVGDWKTKEVYAQDAGENETDAKAIDVIISNCEFSKYLQNADNRARYEATAARARAGIASVDTYENAAKYAVIIKASFNAESSDSLDSFSAGCLSCHDGKSASNVRTNVFNNPGKKSVMKMISTKHPIGMDYEQYSVLNKGLRNLDEVSQYLTLSEGRVSCITCHDPLSAAKNHLTSTKSEMDLCSVCHIM
jgi:hypothetical protein